MINSKMKKLEALLFAGCLFASASVYAGGLATDSALKPLQAHTVQMEDYTAVVYYTVAENGEYIVVTTIAPNAGVNALASQQRTRINPRQSYEVVLDVGTYGAETLLLSFSAQPNALLVATR